MRHGRKYARHGLGQGTFPAAWWAKHYEIVPACSGYLGSALGPFLADYVLEIHHAGSGHGMMSRPLHFPPCEGIPYKQSFALLTGKDADAVSERFYSINGNIGELGRLQGGM